MGKFKEKEIDMDEQRQEFMQHIADKFLKNFADEMDNDGVDSAMEDYYDQMYHEISRDPEIQAQYSLIDLTDSDLETVVFEFVESEMT